MHISCDVCQCRFRDELRTRALVEAAAHGTPMLLKLLSREFDSIFSYVLLCIAVVLNVHGRYKLAFASQGR